MVLNQKYERILVGLDGSDLSKKALSQAIEVAKRNEAKLFIAQIIPSNVYITPDANMYTQTVELEKDRVKGELAQAVRVAHENGLSDVTPVLTVGSPKREIAIKIPEECQIDLIMIGVTGKGMIERMFMGSVAQYVSAHAKANVLLIK